LNFYHIVLVVVLTVISVYYIHYYRVVHRKTRTTGWSTEKPAQSLLHHNFVTVSQKVTWFSPRCS